MKHDQLSHLDYFLINVQFPKATLDPNLVFQVGEALVVLLRNRAQILKGLLLLEQRGKSPQPLVELLTHH